MNEAATDDLAHVIQDLSSCRDADDLMRVITQGVRSLTGADGATVVLREGRFCHYVDESAITPLWKGKRFPLESCISGWCMMNREQVAITDIYEDERIPYDAYRPTFVLSLAMTPLRTADPLGAIGAYWSTKHEATPEELARLQSLGDAAAAVLSTNPALFDSLQEANRR